ncbi:imidazolonepropionase [Gracilimonas sediminicola]|uniref:Imidazolonepropionase n=1 Tax=Gracilimonas sediminicola TaxID=2952158 RepID=A0A9X2L3N4_9BACT|nr:imidazolonepropionase [Gracilimonas sediminicola]MCP9291692.1 imidazolonepropionase [Gracilimonas sediminicola]
MPDLLIQNISQIATPKPGVTRGSELRSLNVIENASIFISDGVIQAIGPLSEVLKQVEGHPVILDAEGKAAVPGFVDSHSHLVFGGNRADEFAMRSAGMSYEEIAEQGGGIVSTVEATQLATKEELKNIARIRLQKALRQGITTMEIKSGYGLNLDNERKMLEVINELKEEQPIELKATFLGAHAVPKNSTKEEYVEEVLNMIPEIAELADYCDVFCEDGYFTKDESRSILEKGMEHGLKPKIHTNQFNDIGGVEMALDLDAVSVDHLEVLSDEDVDRIAGSDTVATILPGVSYFLNIPYSPARKLIDRGALVALATDFNPGSSMTISMQLLMSMACTKMGMSVEEALSCATQNGAKALERKKLGCIAPGFQADILLLDTDNYKDLAYFFGENHVHTVIKKGEKVWESRG